MDESIGMFGLLLSFTLSAPGDAVRARYTSVHHEVASVVAACRQREFYPPALRHGLRDCRHTVLNAQLQHPTPTPRQCQRQMVRLAPPPTIRTYTARTTWCSGPGSG